MYLVANQKNRFIAPPQATMHSLPVLEAPSKIDALFDVRLAAARRASGLPLLDAAPAQMSGSDISSFLTRGLLSSRFSPVQSSTQGLTYPVNRSYQEDPTTALRRAWFYGRTSPISKSIPDVYASSHKSSECKTTTIPSPRSLAPLKQHCRTPKEASETLTLLGKTPRSKADPFIDAALIPDPHVNTGNHNLFPDKLYRLLMEVRDNGEEDIVSFLPHGRAFVVHKIEEFEQKILPRYFPNQKRWGSFARQLQLYGFSRVREGQDAGAYYHELFLDGIPSLCRYMYRVRAPTGLDGRRYKLADGEDPNFYRMRSIKDSREEAKRVQSVQPSTGYSHAIHVR